MAGDDFPLIAGEIETASAFRVGHVDIIIELRPIQGGNRAGGGRRGQILFGFGPKVINP